MADGTVSGLAKGPRLWLVVALLAMATGAIYVTRLSFAPVYLVNDEVQFGRQAATLHGTGRDLDGRRWPLFFGEPGYSVGRDPVLIYASALVLNVVPLSEFSVRLPTALVGVIDVVLMFLLARRVFRRDWLALVAAGFVALAPGHFMHSRLGVSLIVPLPFVLAWLLCLTAYLEDDRKLWRLGAATCALGLGVYAYLGTVMMMALYLAGTAVVVCAKPVLRRWTVALVAFLVPLGPLVAWEILHPRYAELIRIYHPYAPRFTMLQGMKEMLSYFSLSTRSAAYWLGLSPSFLFLTGDASYINGTREAGVFLWPLALLMAVGVHAILTDRRSRFTLLLLAGFLTAPLPSVVTADTGIRYELVIVPFGALIAAFGVERLLVGQRRVAWQAAGLALLLVMPLSFRSFYRDYMGENRIRSAPWFRGNIRDALVAVIDRAPNRPAPAYLNNRIPYVDQYWNFYLLARGRTDLLASTVYFDGEHMGQAPDGSLLVTAPGMPPSVETLASTGWLQVAVSLDPGNTVSYLVFEKRQP